MDHDIDSFKGEYAFLSNFYPCRIFLDTQEYGSVEHAYQAAKTNDPSERERIKRATTAGKAKAMGRTITLRPDWESLKSEVMENLVIDKFSNNKGLAWRLLATGDSKVLEGNNWGDQVWGVTKSPSGNWIGLNKLGEILMRVRGLLRAKN